MNEQFLTIQEAAKIIGVTTLTLRNWDKSGKFTASRHPINNYRVYKKSEIEMLMSDLASNQWKTKKPKSQTRKLTIRHLDDE